METCSPSTLEGKNIWDNSNIQPDIIVDTFDGKRGIITNWHLTEEGKRNQGVEVLFPENKKDYYYASQLFFVKFYIPF